MTNPMMCHHGLAKARGCAHAAVGSFSRLFPKLDSVTLSEAEAAALGGPGGVMHDFDAASPDCPIPAGYIFFAQFVDHDVTLDTTSQLRGAALDAKGVAALPNIRSASLDLDCVYGFGPEGSPQIYDPARPGRIAMAENGVDLARSPGGVALIGDPRNDENIFVSQMQLMLQRLHNRIFNERVSVGGGARFEAAQEETRFHYQWLVLFDFLKRLCDVDVWRFAAEKLVAQDPAFPLIYKPDAHGKLTMPVEFSVAAFRVGHTLVRNRYIVNAEHTDIELFDEGFSATGFTALPPELAVDWRFQLPVDPCVAPLLCKAVDPLMVDELQDLPVVASNNPADRALAFRNLLRGHALGLPSGQDVAQALRVAGYPIPNVNLKLAEVDGWRAIEGLNRKNKPLTLETPLFYHLLRESEVGPSAGQRFGPTGSAILMEVFGGMLRFCANTVLHHPDWRPDPCVARKADGMAETVDMDRVLADPDYYPFELADVARFAAG